MRISAPRDLETLVCARGAKLSLRSLSKRLESPWRGSRGLIYDLPATARPARIGVSSKISLNSRSHLQHFQRPTPSHFCKDTPSLSCGGYEHVARGSRGRLKIFETQNSRVLLATT